MRVRAGIAGLLTAALTVGMVAAQQPASEEDTIRGLLADGPVGEEQFADSFLDSVPLAQVEQLLGQIRSTIGLIETVRGAAGRYEVDTRTHTMPVEIALDTEGRIAGLFFGPPVERGATPAEVAGQFDTLEGRVSYLVLRDGAVLAESDADAPLAVGSAFKLGVLALLDEAIERGERSWGDVVQLSPEDISLPTGILQDFPVGAPVTLHTAAALMISISDNTATDLLIGEVGRAALAERLGIDFALTTREFFFLKGDIEAREAFLAADAEGKQAVVTELAGREMPALNPNLPLHDEGVEWYVPVRRLCELIEAVADLDVMGINPGLARGGEWAQVAFKGGSETGVLNMTTHLTAADGTRYCVALTVNADTPIQSMAPSSAYASLLAALAADETAAAEEEEDG